MPAFPPSTVVFLQLAPATPASTRLARRPVRRLVSPAARTPDASASRLAPLREARDYPLPDIVSYLEEQTHLTRRSLVAILLQSGRLDEFRNNP